MIIKFLKPFSFLPAILLMYMIYSFSAQDGTASSQLSYQVSYRLVEIGGEVLGADLQPWEVDTLATRFHVPVRKLAHMTEYFLLAIAVSFPLYVYGLRGILLLVMAGVICVGFACGDEYHQGYVAGRGPSGRDVMIDSVGVFFGIILVRIIGWAGRKTVFRPFSRHKGKNAEAANPRLQPQMTPQMARQAAPGYQSYPEQSQIAQQGIPGYPNYPRQPQMTQQSASDYQNYPGQSQMTRQGVPGYQDYQEPYPSDYRNRPADRYPQQPYPPYDQNILHSQNHYYDMPPYSAHPQKNFDFYDEEDSGTSDRLSEDMSLRKLVSDLKGQKQARHASQKSSRLSE